LFLILFVKQKNKIYILHTLLPTNIS